MPSYARFVQLRDELNAMSLFRYILAVRTRREFAQVGDQYGSELLEAVLKAGEEASRPYEDFRDELVSQGLLDD